MNFTQQGNILVSSDGRFRIERIDDNRGRTYCAWQVHSDDYDWDGCWIYLGQFNDSMKAKTACEHASGVAA